MLTSDKRSDKQVWVGEMTAQPREFAQRSIGIGEGPDQIRHPHRVGRQGRRKECSVTFTKHPYDPPRGVLVEGIEVHINPYLHIRTSAL